MKIDWLPIEFAGVGVLHLFRPKQLQCRIALDPLAGAQLLVRGVITVNSSNGHDPLYRDGTDMRIMHPDDMAHTVQLTMAV